MLLTWHNLTYYQSLMQGRSRDQLAGQFSDLCDPVSRGMDRRRRTLDDENALLDISLCSVIMPLSHATPDDAMLERVANPATGKHYIVRLTCPEFTSLCPLTGQPDFAHLMIDYIPKDWIVESKSFKLLSEIISKSWGLS